MNPYRTIEKLNLGDSANRLISSIINTELADSTLYIGTINIAPQAEPSLDNLPWIPKNIDHLKVKVEELNSITSKFDEVSQLAKDVENSPDKGLSISLLKLQFNDLKNNFTKQADYLHSVLSGIYKSVNELEYPQLYTINSLHRINEQGSSQLIKTSEGVEFNSNKLLKEYLTDRPMRYLLFNISKDSAFVAQGYKTDSKLGAAYEQIWQNVNSEPEIKTSSCLWRS